MGRIPWSTVDGHRSWLGQGDVALVCTEGQWKIHPVIDRSHKMPGSSLFFKLSFSFCFLALCKIYYTD